MKAFNVLYENEKFDVIQIDNITGLNVKTVSVGIMPFTIDKNESDLVEQVGLLKEYNPFRDNNFCYTLITGIVEKEDETLLDTAKRELLKEGGFDVPADENHRWIYLGTFFPYKDSNKYIPTFAVDVTDLSQSPLVTDGSVKELNSVLEFLPVNQIMITEETLPLSAFLRLFNYYYQKSLGNV